MVPNAWKTAQNVPPIRFRNDGAQMIRNDGIWIIVLSPEIIPSDLNV
ncbi:MAG: hypothetical protein CM15mP47_4480 [Methanobacteriota archaeon]|nr:MAG: hypothetical protein CM15mP47_4480 [Euryarchaeota archaeon]